ncbi:class F sortase [Jatrophihabitans sp.]|uniref:class F sortase n=1 Tax=Jatrophihabitans sp. TaxID=1932789 RepID=UPI003F807794
MNIEARARRTRLLGGAGAVLLLAGVLTVVIALRAQRSAPQPPASAASPVNVIPTGTTPPRPPAGPTATVPGPGQPNGPSSGSGGTRGLILPRSRPVRLQIASIGVDSTLRQIGLNSAGEIVTPPLDKDSHAYWLTVSPTPGELGPATIIGHVDSAAFGPGVFFKLGAMRQRAKILITRADGTVALFEVERVAEYKKNAFPTQQVYGNIDHAGLRLITCGGDFNSSISSYDSNIVVYAALVSVRSV